MNFNYNSNHKAIFVCTYGWPYKLLGLYTIKNFKYLISYCSKVQSHSQASNMGKKPELDDIQRLSPTHWTINLVATEIPWCQKWKWSVISKCCASLKVWLIIISNELLASLGKCLLQLCKCNYIPWMKHSYEFWIPLFNN